MNIGIITYQHPHLKTEQVILRLLSLPNNPFTLHIDALPFTPKPLRETLIQHRPDQTQAVLPKDLATRYGLSFANCTHDTEISTSMDYHLLCGAGMLSKACVENRRIINCHPGAIPSARGLDAFKWSLYHKIPLGVTLHIIDEGIDAGEIISVVETPVFGSDTLSTLARRHYENEINVLSRFFDHLEKPIMDFTNLPTRAPASRMPLEKEKALAQLTSLTSA